MMSRIGVLAFGALLSVALMGCSQEQSPAPGSMGTKTEVAKSDAPPRATLQLVPGTVDSCEVGATIDPVVSWQRIDPSIRSTRVTTDNPANPEEKLFAKAGFGGSSRAGNWVVAGTRFHVYDDQTGVELVSYTVKTGKNCAN
ncbi:hypothetical protein UU7_09155 [Rhodanobacter spathiphylli B39]|uniref:Lipoprotein n=2 Tax=Rhodanobacter TaxID=75309 RepID=I4W1H3_9GAMM|nr:hypothetical protein UU7_09155 [Rhodanobacter spathiphylli B39]